MTVLRRIRRVTCCTLCMCRLCSGTEPPVWRPCPRSNEIPTYKSCRWTRLFLQSKIARLPARVSNPGSAAGNAERGAPQRNSEHVVQLGGTTRRAGHLAERALKGERSLSREGRAEPQPSKSCCIPLTVCSVQAEGNSPPGELTVSAEW